jgi:hypothetical protein
MQASDILFRSSGVGHIMSEGGAITEKQLEELAYLQGRPKPTDNQVKKIAELVAKRDNPDLPAGVKTHLLDIFASAFYGRREEVTSKHLEKGNDREQDSITLFSRVTRCFYEKNTERIKNEYIQGEPDMFLGEDIYHAEETADTKTSWSLHTFLRSKFKPLDEMYFYQGQCYMWLTGAKRHSVVFCLVNGTPKAILDEKFKLSRTMGETHPEFKQRCRQIEINHIFDMQHFMHENPGFDFDCDVNEWCFDIPMKDRIHIFSFDRDEQIIDKIRQRVIMCREWMDEELFKAALITA